VLAFLLQPTARDPGRLRMPVRGLAMAVVQALGLLSHFSFVFVTLSLVGYSGMKALRSREDRLEPLQLHLLPLLTLATLYLGLVRGQTLGGGPELGVLDVVSSTAALLLGVPDTSPLKWVALGFLVLLQLGGLQVLRREGRDDWLFFALVCFCVPALVLVIARPELLYPRYFFVCLPFALYLLSVALYALIEAGGVQAGIGFVALVLVIAGNARALKDFYQDGRGHYLEAMRYMVEKTPNKLLVIASDHDFRSQAIIRYYAQFLPSDRQIYYVEGKQFAELGSQWYLIHSQDAHPQVPQEFQDPRGARYVLEQVYPYSSLSGWHWFLYHNVSEQE
jgi:hypothetical protein